MAQTPYLKLQKPPFDTVPWDVAVNGNMDILDGYISRYMNVPNFVGAWTNSTAYSSGQTVLDTSNSYMYTAQVTHTSAASPTTFAQDRTNNPTYWTQLSIGSPGAGYAPLLSPVFTGDPQAPTAAPGDNDVSIATTAFVHGEVATAQAALMPAFNDIGRNLLHNGKFNVAQRGLGPFTTSVYNADRWIASTTLDAISYVIVAAPDATRTQIGDESVAWILQNTFTGNAGATAVNNLIQRIEGVRRLAGKTVTISFWANAAVAGTKLGFNLIQSFGTGGSPSATVRALATGNAATLSTTWQRYNTTIAIPSIVGKTLGTNGNDYTGLEIYFSSGANANALAGNIGVQSGTVNLWGLQLEVGSVMTPLERIDPGLDYYNCLRFYQIGQAFSLGYAAGAGQFVGSGVSLSSIMRAAPNITVGSAVGADTNVSAASADSPTPGFFRFVVTATGAGQAIAGRNFTASADL